LYSEKGKSTSSWGKVSTPGTEGKKESNRWFSGRREQEVTGVKGQGAVVNRPPGGA